MILFHIAVSLEEEAQVIPKIPEFRRELKLDAEAENTISDKIKKLNKSFIALLQKLKNELKDVNTAEVVEYLEENGLEYLPLEDLKTAEDFRDLISKVKANFDFLDCSLLQLIAEGFATKALFEEFEEHSKETAKFRESHTVDDLRDNLTEIFNPYLDDLEKGPIARIDLNNAWNSIQLNRLRTLIGCFFPDISTKSLTKHVLIKCRSVHITYYMTESPDQIQQIIACARERVDFMKRIGLYHLVINGEVILDEAEKKDFKFESALLEAAKVGDSEAVEVLLQIGRGTDVLGDISKALFDACDNNHYRVVKLLLNESANPNVRDTDGEPAIHAASRKGHHKIVELLLKENADPDARYQINQESEGASPLGTIAQFSELLFGHESVGVRQNIDKTALMAASFNNHYQVVELLLKANADPNIQKKDGRTALMLASQSGHIESVELLLKAKADPNVKEEDGWTALMLACQGDHTKVVELLINANANVNTRQKDGATALMIASQGGRTQVVQLLLKEKADPNICSNNGNTALMLATFNNHHQVVELLLKEKVNPNIQKKGGLTALMLASLRGHIESVELLLKAKADPNVKEDGKTALMLASYKGHYHVVELLLKENANPDIKEEHGWTALLIASLSGHQEVAELLLQNNANLNIPAGDGRTILMGASLLGHHQMVELLLRQNAIDPNIQENDGWTALMLASVNGHHKVVELLLKAGADPNIKEEDGWTALMVASQEGQYQVVELLLNANAHVHITQDNGGTVLMVASQSGHAGLVELLLTKNPNPNIQAHDGWTALMQASQSGYHKIIELLLQVDVEPDIKEEDGWTALMMASQGGYYQAVQLLLNANADPNIVSDNGCTAIAIASQNGHLQVVKLLFANNADPTIQKGGRSALVMASLKDRKEIVEFLIKEQEDHGFTTLMTAIHSEIIELVLSLLSAGIMTYIDKDHVQAAIHFSKMESEVDNQITELLRYYAEDVYGMKLSESQVKVNISSEMKQKVNESSYHLESNIRMASRLAQDPDEHPLLRYAEPLEKLSSDPYAADEHDATEKFKAAVLRKLGDV